MNDLVKMTFLLVLVTATGCATAERPYVQLQIEGDDEFAKVVVVGANAWSRLGFHAGVDAPVESVPVMKVTVRQYPGLSNEDRGDGTIVGYTHLETNVIDLDGGLTGLYLQHVMAHELGHLIEGSAAHITDPSRTGIMFYKVTWILEPTQDDYDLICGESGICL